MKLSTFAASGVLLGALGQDPCEYLSTCAQHRNLQMSLIQMMMMTTKMKLQAQAQLWVRPVVVWVARQCLTLKYQKLRSC